MFFRARFYFHGFQFILQAFLSFQADCWNSKSKWYNTADRISASGVIILGPVSFSHPGPVSFRLTYPPSTSPTRWRNRLLIPFFYFLCFSVSLPLPEKDANHIVSDSRGDVQASSILFARNIWLGLVVE